MSILEKLDGYAGFNEPSRGSYAKGAIILCAALYVLFEKVASPSGNNHTGFYMSVCVTLNLSDKLKKVKFAEHFIDFLQQGFKSAFRRDFQITFLGLENANNVPYTYI